MLSKIVDYYFMALYFSVLPGTTLSTVLKMSTAVYSHWTSDVISVDGLTYTGIYSEY